jgi:hypothetical protein
MRFLAVASCLDRSSASIQSYCGQEAIGLPRPNAALPFGPRRWNAAADPTDEEVLDLLGRIAALERPSPRTSRLRDPRQPAPAFDLPNATRDTVVNRADESVVRRPLGSGTHQARALSSTSAGSHAGSSPLDPRGPSEDPVLPRIHLALLRPEAICTDLHEVFAEAGASPTWCSSRVPAKRPTSS